jgi:hypothetical protein
MRRRRQNEGGYALLLVFALAAAVAVKFYLELPRVAFEHQRSKEGLLVERGEQYIRAIKLYYRKNQKWPQNLEDLEKSQESRYLRKRYKDPMTGEDEWRLVHIDGAGRYTDSLIKKAGEEEEKRPDLLAARVQGIGASAEVVDTGGDAASNNPALQRRASDKLIPGSSGEAGQALGPPGNEGVAVPPEGSMSGLVGQSQMPSPLPGQAPVTGPPVAGGAGAAPGGQGSSTGGGFGMGGGFGFGASAPSPPSPPSSGSSGTAGAGSGPSPINRGAAGEAGQQNQALRLINQILSAPRQTGQGGTFGPQSGTGVATGIGGLAGVASKKDMDGIMVYNEQTNYKKWEFVYDLKKELEAKGMMGGPTNPAGTNQSGTGQNPQRSTTGPGSMFGTMGQTPGKQ